MANKITPDDVFAIPEPVMFDENEEPEEEEFEEEEEPQEKEDMEADIEEDENEPELMFPYEESDPINPPPPASDSEIEDVDESEDIVESKDVVVPASVYEKALVEKKGKAKDKHYGRLILDLGDEMHCIEKVEERMTALENRVEGFANTEERAECKKLKRDLEEANLDNTLLRMQKNESKEISILLEFELMISIKKWFIEDLCLKKAKIMPPKSAPLTQASVRRMIKESINAAIATEQERHANARSNAGGSGQTRGQATAPTVRECTFTRFIKCKPDNFCGTKGAVELRRWFEKTEMTFRISECAEDKKVKFAATTLRGPALTWWNSKVSFLSLDVASQIGWTEMKKLMTSEFYLA
nr:hypothetical protein [Tanacetum cinerariifolium]